MGTGWAFSVFLVAVITTGRILVVFENHFHFQAVHPAHCLDQGGGWAAGVHRAVHPPKVDQVHPPKEEAVHIPEADEVHPPEVVRGRNKLKESDSVLKSKWRHLTLTSYSALRGKKPKKVHKMWQHKDTMKVIQFKMWCGKMRPIELSEPKYVTKQGNAILVTKWGQLRWPASQGWIGVNWTLSWRQLY